MKRILAGAVALSLLAGTSTAALADAYHPTPPQLQQNNPNSWNGNPYRGDYRNDDRGDYRNGYRNDFRDHDRRDHKRWNGRYGKGHAHHWRRGERIDRWDWDHGRRVDYRVSHLHHPRRGYEWREVNGQFVEAAIVGGLIAAVVIAASN